MATKARPPRDLPPRTSDHQERRELGPQEAKPPSTHHRNTHHTTAAPEPQTKLASPRPVTNTRTTQCNIQRTQETPAHCMCPSPANGHPEKLAHSCSKLAYNFQKQFPRKFIPPKIILAKISFLRLFCGVMI